jgi:hypothetical protein
MDHHRKRRLDEYRIDIYREYDRADWEAAEWLNPGAEEYWEHGMRSEEDEVIELADWEIEPQEDIAMAGEMGLIGFVVSSRLRRELEASGLEHIQFKPVRVVDEQTPHPHPQKTWEQIGCEPYWELWSDYVLPAMAPSVQFADQDGKPIPRDQDCSVNGRFISEPPYRNVELHYTASAVAGTEPFGLALTREHFGFSPRTCRPGLIASNRFYDFCMARNLKMSWAPVRIDPD